MGFQLQLSWQQEQCISIKDLFKLRAYKQIIKTATRLAKDSSTLIDVILTNQPDNVINTNSIISSLKLNTDWNMYKTAQNHATNITQRAQKTHYKSVLRDSEKKPKKFWEKIKTIFPTKIKGPTSRSFNIDATCTTNKKSIAGGFC